MSYTDFDFPHTSLYTTDLREIIANIRRLEDIVKTFVTTEQVKFADPIIWNITSQYQKNTIVLNTSGNAYLSKQAVPSGIQLNNEDYWQEIFNFTDYTRTANQNLTVNVETNTTRATYSYNIDDWLIWNDVLYRVTASIAVDDTLVVGTNLVHFTVEDFIKAFITYATNLINQYKNDIDASELAYQSAMQAQVDRILAGATVDSEVIDARLGWNGVEYSTLGNAIRTQFTDINKDVDNLRINLSFPLTWEQGGLGTVDTGGNPYASNARIRTPYFTHISNEPIIIEAAAGYDLAYRSYTYDGTDYTCVGSISFTPNNVSIPSDGKYYRLLVKRTDGSDLLPSAGNNFNASEVVYTDTSLTLAGKAADSKTVGELAQLYRGSITVDSDLNDFTDNGMYLFYSGHTYSNTPSFYSVGQFWLIVRSNTTSSHSIQEFVRITASVNRIAWRACVNGTWTDWKEYMNEDSDEIVNALKFAGNIQVDSDLNDFTSQGDYLFYSGHTYTNVPELYTSGLFWLEVIGMNANYIVQRFTKPSGGGDWVAIRTRVGGTWTKWNMIVSAPVLVGKKFSILGDSISTYQNEIPSGYPYYYPHGSVDTPEEMWYNRLADATGMELLSNASWSGNGVCNDGTIDVDSDECPYSNARVAALSDGESDPDFIFVFIGTNDFRHDFPIGSATAHSDLESDLTAIGNFKGAYSCMLNKIVTTYPSAKIYCCTCTQRYYSSDSSYPVTNGNTNTISEFNEAIAEMASWFGCDVIDLNTLYTLAGVYNATVDHALHPNVTSQRKIATKIANHVISDFYKSV